MRKVHEQVTQASHDIIEMEDKNKKSDTTTTNATTTSPHTSKSNEVKILFKPRTFCWLFDVKAMANWVA
jgi:hypothetical protein